MNIEIEKKRKDFEIYPRNRKNVYNCIFCNENTGECLFNVNFGCQAYCRHYCRHKVSFNPRTQLKTKLLFDNLIENLKGE